MEKRVYLDNAAATAVRNEVIEEMLPFFDIEFGNPSTVYDMGSRVKASIDDQRAKVASLIGARPEEIIFTSGGTEANNLAIKGIAFAHRKKGDHIIIGATEHHSVLNSARFFERLDYEVTFLQVDEYGLVDPQRLKELIRPETILVSVAHASNEIGTIQPIAEIAEVCRDKNVFFHTDAVASVGNIPIDVKELGVDLLSLSGIPLRAPKGTGALYFRKGLRLMPLLHGGIQESGRRGGTENVPGIIGLGKAAELTLQELPQKIRHVKVLRDKLVKGIIDSVENIKLTGHPENRLPGHASLCIQAIEGEALVFLLNSHGIYVNTGSACASKALKTSPVLVAIGVPPELAQGSIVFTLDMPNTEDDIDYVLEKLPIVVNRLRSMSPLWGKRETVQAG